MLGTASPQTARDSPATPSGRWNARPAALTLARLEAFGERGARGRHFISLCGFSFILFPMLVFHPHPFFTRCLSAHPSLGAALRGSRGQAVQHSVHDACLQPPGLPTLWALAVLLRGGEFAAIRGAL